MGTPAQETTLPKLLVVGTAPVLSKNIRLLSPSLHCCCWSHPSATVPRRYWQQQIRQSGQAHQCAGGELGFTTTKDKKATADRPPPVRRPKLYCCNTGKADSWGQQQLCLSALTSMPFALQQSTRQANAAFSRLLKMFIAVQHIDEHFVRAEDARLHSTDSTGPMAPTSFLQL